MSSIPICQKNKATLRTALGVSCPECHSTEIESQIDRELFSDQSDGDQVALKCLACKHELTLYALSDDERERWANGALLRLKLQWRTR